jgi:rhomboid protease GluP
MQISESLIPEHSTMTLLFLLINVAFFIASLVISANQGNSNAIMSLDNRTLILLGAKWRPEIVFGGQWWRLITAGLLHGGAMHIIMNGMSLYHVGRHFEDYLGSTRFVIVYILSTITGFGLSLIASPYSTSVGASAALAGMVGALLASSALPGSPTLPGRRIYTYWTLGLLVVGFLGNLSGMMRIDNAAHIGGLIGGYLFIRIAGFPGPDRSGTEMVWRVLSFVLIAVTLFSFWKMYLFFSALSQGPAYRMRF